jgi:hypothetical protein
MRRYGKARNVISNSFKEKKDMMRTICEKANLDPSEAADKLLIVREVKELDEQNDTVNRLKAALFKSARTFGFIPAAIKEIARPTYPDQVDNDEKALRGRRRHSEDDEGCQPFRFDPVWRR